MKIFITNITGSQKEVAEMDSATGIVTFNSGELSTLQFEKSMGKAIRIHTEEVAPAPVVETLPTERSDTRPMSKSKSKSSNKA